MTFSEEKSVIIPFTRRRIQIDIKIKLNNTPPRIETQFKYLGVILDNKLSWKQHIEYIKSKAEKRVGIIKWIIKKFRLRQDASITSKNKLRTIEQKVLSTALGVNKLAKRSEVNLEAATLPLDLRRKRKSMRAYCKWKQDKETQEIKSNKRKRFKSKTRASFIERAEKLTRGIKINSKKSEEEINKEIEAKISRQCEEKIKEERKRGKIYAKIETKRN